MSDEIIKRIFSSIILIPFSFYCVIYGTHIFSIFLFTVFLITCFEWRNMSEGKSYQIFGFIYLFFSFLCVYKLRISFDDDIPFLIIISICILTDIGGFIFGKFFKGPKLTKLSPNKTYSGLLGSYCFAYFTIPLMIIFELNNEMKIFNLMILIFIISSVSQIGDIFISFFKRISKIKDTGKIIPGHGGILDRIDGMIFALPVLFFNQIQFFKII